MKEEGSENNGKRGSKRQRSSKEAGSVAKGGKKSSQGTMVIARDGACVEVYFS